MVMMMLDMNVCKLGPVGDLSHFVEVGNCGIFSHFVKVCRGFRGYNQFLTILGKFGFWSHGLAFTINIYCQVSHQVATVQRFAELMTHGRKSLLVSTVALDNVRLGRGTDALRRYIFATLEEAIAASR
jgi:hypothetical protein